MSYHDIFPTRIYKYNLDVTDLKAYMLDRYNSYKDHSVNETPSGWNCNVRTENIIRHGFHVDVPTDYDSKTAILYLNTNNGYTEFENGQRVESVANRLVVFDSALKHTGTTCTDQKRRIVLNLNYID